jgi:hypothetical protein
VGELEPLKKLLWFPERQGAGEERAVAEAWARAVGVEVACNSRPQRLRRGRLTVSVSSAAWAQTLQLLSGKVVAALNEALGAEVVREVRFHPGGWASVSDDSSRPTVAPFRRLLTAEEEQEIAEVVAKAGDEGLARLIAAAMRADLEGRPT